MNFLGFKRPLNSSSLSFQRYYLSIRRHIKMASETKIQEEKEEKESSLVSTKVPKARVRFIRRVLRRSFSIHSFLFSLCSFAQKTNFPWKR